MRSLRVITSVIVTIATLLMAAPAGAQSYEGDSLEEGILYVPADLAPGSSLNFSVSELEAGSELTFVLTSPDGTEVSGIDVQVRGAVVLLTDSQGNFNGDIALPAGLESGVYTLTVTGTRADGSDYERSFAFNVGDAAAGSASNDTPAALALTGTSSRGIALNGLLIVGVGVALVMFAARKGSSKPVREDV